MDAAQNTFDLENDIRLVDPARDALFAYDPARDREAKLAQPWKMNRTHYKHIRISAVALLKMVTHAREGGSLEVMGLMSGTVQGDTFIVTDAYRLPVEGTETRVNAYEDAYEYMTEFPRLSKQAGKLEDAVGWYHSHPGYGCWLSGIDVQTQQSWQTQDPFVAVVIDPDRTIAGGKVEIGAFRTYKNAVEANSGTGEWAESDRKKKMASAATATATDADTTASASTSKKTTTASSDSSNGNTTNVQVASSGAANAAVDKSSLSTDKAKDLGLHADQYYALQVSHFRSTLDTAVLEALWRTYWTKTLTSSSARLGASNRDAVTRRIEGLAAGLVEVSRAARNGGVSGSTAALEQSGPEQIRRVRPGGPGGGGGAGALQSAGPNAALESIGRAAEGVAMEARADLMASRVRDRVFGVDDRWSEPEEGVTSHVSPAGGVTDQLQELQVRMQT